MNNPNPTACNVKETIRVLKCPEVQGSLQLAREVELYQIAYVNEARGLKRLKILGFRRCNEGTMGDEAVNNPNPPGCKVNRNYQCIEISASSRLPAARKKCCTRSNSL